MRLIRFIPLCLGWFLLGLSVAIFMAATGLGWIGEHVMMLAFKEG